MGREHQGHSNEMKPKEVDYNGVHRIAVPHFRICSRDFCGQDQKILDDSTLIQLVCFWK